MTTPMTPEVKAAYDFIMELKAQGKFETLRKIIQLANEAENGGQK